MVVVPLFVKGALPLNAALNVAVVPELTTNAESTPNIALFAVKFVPLVKILIDLTPDIMPFVA